MFYDKITIFLYTTKFKVITKKAHIHVSSLPIFLCFGLCIAIGFFLFLPID